MKGDRSESRANQSPVVVSITSGLGNQLFQYAFARWIAEANGAALYINTSWFDYFQRHRPLREVRMRRLEIPGTMEYFKGIRRWLLGLASVGSPRLRENLQKIIGPGLGVVFYNERRRNVMPTKLPIPDKQRPLILSGYWQFSQPGGELGEKIGKEIKGKWQWSKGAKKIQDEIHGRENVAFMHIRRGDYIGFGTHLLTKEYYQSAAHLIESTTGVPIAWYLFSEDREWCRENLKFLTESKIVEYTSGDSDIEDLLLMSECQAGVIANSSFSWWGAALGERKDRPIVCPMSWWGGSEGDCPDLRLKHWIAVE